MDSVSKNIRLEPTKGVFAVSANLLVGRFFPNAYEWLREREPVATMGYSILIFEEE